MGVLIAFTIILSWGIHLFYLLTSVKIDFHYPLFYFHILLQAYLFTGLFITAHDAMHGNISRIKHLTKQLVQFHVFYLQVFHIKDY